VYNFGGAMTVGSITTGSGSDSSGDSWIVEGKGGDTSILAMEVPCQVQKISKEDGESCALKTTPSKVNKKFPEIWSK